MTRFLIRSALALLIASSAFAGTTQVTTTADSGPGSLQYVRMSEFGKALLVP